MDLSPEAGIGTPPGGQGGDAGRPGGTSPKRFHILAYREVAGAPPLVTEVSELLAGRFGSTPDQIENDPGGFARLVHPDDRERVLAQHASALRAGTPLTLEYRLGAPGGAALWVQDEAIAVAERPGPPGLRGHCLDITLRKTTLEELHQREAHFRAVVANIPGVVYRCAVDRNWTMFYMSDYMEKLLGYPASDFIGNRVRRYGSIIHPDDHGVVIQEIDKAMATGSAYSLEYRLIHADGRPRWIAERGRVVLAEDGHPLWLDGVLLDIGRQKLAEESRDRAEDELRQQALYDSLTALPNRTLFDDRALQAIADARREKTELAVLMMDLDRFKEINDTFGHATGDRVLTEVARRLKTAVREGDTIARLGGDEFAVLLRKAALQSLLAVVERIRRAVEQPLELDGIPVSVGVSVGIARFPYDGTDVAVLLQHADVAMYSAKHANAGHALYDVSIQSDLPARPALIDELKNALESHQLVLHYQPKIAIRGGGTTGVEALVRWRHPIRGLLLPDQFLYVAREGGLVKQLTRYVLDEALRQCRAWTAEGRELVVSVNVWMRNLLDGGFPDDVAAALASQQVPAHRLQLEVNAGALLADAWRAKPALERLAELGVRLSVDDFGAADASLAYLRRLPIHELKIDRAFVTTMASSVDDAFVVRSAIDLGRHLGLTIVAEGVQDKDVWDRLARLGCDTAQGFYLGHPVPADELGAWLDGSPHPGQGLDSQEAS